LRIEIEAAIATLCQPPANGEAVPTPSAGPSGKASGSARAGKEAGTPSNGNTAGDGDANSLREFRERLQYENGRGPCPSDKKVDPEIMKWKKKLREIEKLKQKPSEDLDVLQKKKVEGEAEVLAKLRELGYENEAA